MQLLQRQPDGQPLRAHLAAAAAAGAPPDPRLGAQPPRHGLDVWDTWCELAAARPEGLAGGQPVPPSEIVAWQILHGVRLTPWQADTLMAMDRAALAVMQQARADQPGARKETS